MISRQRNQLVAEVRAFGEYANPLMILRGNTIVSKWPANENKRETGIKHTFQAQN